MRRVSATDAKRNLAALLDAAQRESVVIRRHKRDVAVLLSAAKYERQRSLNITEFQSFCDRVAARAAEHGFDAKKLAANLSHDRTGARPRRRR
ncbi:MAG: type II toxin-antitoxin system Phd/YefM family antitoxin [Acetobacteraceae bacterium]|nr:type II toxin-antitoxin system Phd/YefM family antitoxin [Acetobacteraceae bacterium]